MQPFSRRAFLARFSQAGLLMTGLGTAPFAARSEPAIKDAASLKPGQFTWHPERSPSGPVAIVVSITDQRVHVYRNGIRIAVSTCSTGKEGHSTPTGVFTILEKDKDHRSSTYNNAPMPNMNRLTWNGVALHAGNLPGYPASHGCIRLPTKFSELLFTITHVGTPVIIAGSHADPKEVVHPGLVLSGSAAAELESVLENGKPVATGKAVISDPATPLGRHVFMLVGADESRKGLVWHAITHHDQTGVPLGQPEEAVLQRIRADAPVLKEMQARMHPGMVLITTELPAHPDTRTGADFVLMNSDAS